MALKTNYANSVYVQKKYRKDNNGDGTVSFVDTTDYSASGSYYGAEDINAQNLECNILNDGFSVIEQLIAILRDERDIPISGNSAYAIIAALTTDRNTKYATGREAGHAHVQNYPSAYNLVSASTYDPVKNKNDAYTTGIEQAILFLEDYPRYTSAGGAPSYRPSHDPITAFEANEVVTQMNTWLDNVFTAFTEFYTSNPKNANGQLENAYNYLNVDQV